MKGLLNPCLPRSRKGRSFFVSKMETALCSRPRRRGFYSIDSRIVVCLHAVDTEC